jgi:hypothetical protein
MVTPTGHVISVCLQKADKPSATLKELSGTLPAQVLLPEPVITADNILKAAGKSFKGKDNSSFVVREVTLADGRLTLTVEIETARPAIGVPIGPALPPLPPTPAPAPQPGGALPQPGVVIRPGPLPIFPGAGNGFWSLQDDKGQDITLTRTSIRFVQQVAGKWTVQHNLIFLLQKDQVPATFAFKSRRNVTLDIPFTLKDVPIP